MNIAGWTKSSLINFPGHASTVLFIGGCNFRCGYCHNPEIVFSRERAVSEEDLLLFLRKRKRFLDGVCISGGEPTLGEDLPELIRKIKEAGYAVKLDTNGSRPDMLKELIRDKLVDYVAMDIKAPIERYDEIAGVKADQKAIGESIDFLLKEEVRYEFRTTVCKEQIGEDDIRSICRRIEGAEHYFIQTYRKNGMDRQMMSDGRASEQTCFSPYGVTQLEAFRQIALAFVKKAGVR